MYQLGEFVPARVHIEQGIALYNVDQHRSYAFLYGQDPLMGCRIYAAQILWTLGYPEQASQLSEAAVTWAEQLAHPFSLVFALCHSAAIYARLQEWLVVLELAGKVIGLCAEQSFQQWAAVAMSLRNRALVMQGNPEAIAQIRQGMADREATGARTRPAQYTQLADAYRSIGEWAEGLSTVVRGLTVADETDERCYDAELNRLKGERLLQSSSDNATEAESCFQHAISIAQRQQAKSWKLRAATSLAKLWQQQGKRQEAYDLLAPVYGWFTEGFDTADLKDAKALLDELS